MSALSQTIEKKLGGGDVVAADLKRLLDAYPGIGGIGLFVTLETEPGDALAYTDGKRIVVGPAFAQLARDERLGVLAHEILHVGLAHPLRGKRLRANDATYQHTLFNIATDATINYAIGAMRLVRLPAGVVSIEALERETGEKLIGRSSEAIYAILKSKMRVCHECGGAHAKNAHDEASEAECPSGKRSILAGDVRGEGCGFDPQVDSEMIERWGHRTTAGIGSVAGVAERLRGDIPKVTTPWSTILRSFARRFCGVRVERDYRLPHRRWLAGTAANTSGHIIPLHFGTKRAPAGRLAVVVDTSGSIDEDLIGRFTGEIIAIMRTTGAHVRMIVADAAVLQTADFIGNAGIDALRKFGFAGGGGTDFAPAIAAAATWQPDALVYLTDLYGDCGPKPTFPVLWAVCPQGSTEAPAFGQRVDLV